jgi:hypothetical protein
MFAVKTVKRTSTGTVFSGPARVLSIHAIAGGSAGSIVMKDGGASGTTLIDLDTPASSTEGIVNPSFTDEGVRFTSDVHVTLTNVTSITVIFG